MKSNITNTRSGFSLVEVIVVVAILVLLTGALAPMAAQAISSARNESTRGVVNDIANASYRFGEDTLRPPQSIAELKTNINNVAGWNGPYCGISNDNAGPGTTSGGYGNDAFGHAVAIQLLSAVSIKIYSYGEDGSVNTNDDIVSTVDITPALREKAYTYIKTMNNAIQLYNATHLPNAPLSSTWQNAFATLVAGGYLPSTPHYLIDPWGSPYVPNPQGASPVSAVTSTHLASSP
ncbi:MAG: prepilin-type N-terminal cleavage/methylation domain-containing protein [Planctomycetes bacterium]|nr:prepilin-type N-terminal cleavage/methylation domain-containing protein [Planctomycetota bacterium]